MKRRGYFLSPLKLAGWENRSKKKKIRFAVCYRKKQTIHVIQGPPMKEVLYRENVGISKKINTMLAFFDTENTESMVEC